MAGGNILYLRTEVMFFNILVPSLHWARCLQICCSRVCRTIYVHQKKYHKLLSEAVEEGTTNPDQAQQPQSQRCIDKDLLKPLFQLILLTQDEPRRPAPARPAPVLPPTGSSQMDQPRHLPKSNERNV